MSGARVACRLVSLPDYWDLVTARQKWSLPAREYRATAREVAAGRVAGVFVDGRPVFIGAVSSVGAGSSGVAWCFVADGGIAACPVITVRAVRRHLAAVAGCFDRVIAVIDDGNARGQRLATMVGFVPRDAVSLGMRIWEWGDGGTGTGGNRSGRRGLLRRQAVAAGEGDAIAAPAGE